MTAAEIATALEYAIRGSYHPLMEKLRESVMHANTTFGDGWGGDTATITSELRDWGHVTITVTKRG